MLKTLFGYSAKCAENIVKSYKAAKENDMEALADARDSFKHETISGFGKAATRIIGTELVEAVTEDNGLVALASMVLNQKLLIATVAVNSIAAMVTNTMLVQERIRRRPDLLVRANDNSLSREERIAAARLLVA